MTLASLLTASAILAPPLTASSIISSSIAALPIVESWLLTYLLNSLCHVPLLFVAGWLAARWVRRAGAAAEHRVWVCAVLLQGALPVLSLLPWERFQWLRAFAFLQPALGRGNAHVSVVMGAATGANGLALSGAMLSVVVSAYAVLSLYFGARFFWRVRMLAVLRREAVDVPLTGEAARFWSYCMHKFAIANVSLAASSRVSGPVTLGGSRKLVLLPATMVGSLPVDDLKAILAHEFAHMRRNDFTKNLLYEVVLLPVAYHPLAWLTHERVRESREMVCDQLAAGVRGRVAYTQSLLRLASLLVNDTPVRVPHAIGIFDAHTFERRLMKLTEKTKELHGWRRTAAVAACAAMAMATCGTALALRMDVNAPIADQDTTTKKPKKVMVASGVMAGQKLSGENPIYPEEAKKAKIEGTVVLEATISKEGNIENLRSISGPKELQASAIDAVKTWKYKPYLLNGDPVEVTTTINVTYSLGG